MGESLLFFGIFPFPRSLLEPPRLLYIVIFVLGYLFQPYVDWFTGEKMLHPIKDNPESKSSFMPSKWEHKRV